MDLVPNREFQKPSFVCLWLMMYIFNFCQRLFEWYPLSNAVDLPTNYMKPLSPSFISTYVISLLCCRQQKLARRVATYTLLHPMGGRYPSLAKSIGKSRGDEYEESFAGTTVNWWAVGVYVS